MRRLFAWIMAILLLLGMAGCDGAAVQPSGERVKMTEGELQEIFSQEYETPKNVIIMIADGMGANDLILAEQFSKKLEPFGLVLNQIPYQGLATTCSASHTTTDSAAAATALATGVKTKNGMVGMDEKGNPLKNISEIARAEGKKVGIITSDLATGATPSGFTIHNKSRENTKELAASMVDFAPDLLVAKGYEKFYKALDQESKEQLEGYALSKSESTFLNTLQEENGPYFCFSDFQWTEVDDSLARYTEKALEKLENEKGFFLMIESCGTDKCGHDNLIDGKVNGVVTFDRTVTAVLEFMKTHPDTLLLITSDHETGGVRLPKEGEGLSKELFTTTKHTPKDVRVFALGKGAEYFDQKTVDNTDFAKFAIAAVRGEG